MNDSPASTSLDELLERDSAPGHGHSRAHPETADSMSDRARRARAYQVFAQALELDAGSREHFLLEHCRGDASLRVDVEGLLDVALQDDLATSALRGLPSAIEESLAGQTVGRFRLVERIGEGGMGVVYRAERTDGVQQSVAIKLMSSALAAAARPRFEREAQLLARLEHPSIARLIDAGIEDARAWMAIEFVRGQRIDEYCTARHLPPRDIVRLLILLADAVAAAHRMLVVHSDIKPANVLVTPDGLPKLVDFGISSALREAGAAGGGASPTVNIGRLFSPNYAAPEQINGGPLTVSTDVFGLGALAYRLLTGSPPYAEANGAIAYLLAVTQRDVELPSRAALLAGRGPAKVAALRGDLDAILSKALERNPARRYASAADMRADLQRYLDQRPVVARAPSAGYRFRKFIHRNALAAGLSSLLVISLLGGGLFAGLQARRTAVAQSMAARRGEFLETLLQSADPRTGRREMSVAELLDSAAATLHQRFGDEPLVEASMLGLIADTNDGLGRYPEGLAANGRQLALLRSNGGSALDIGRALSSRGELLREQGRWLEAEPVLQQALALLRPLRAPTELAGALDLLGIVEWRTYRAQEAEATFLEEIAIESRGNQPLQNRRIYPYQALGALMNDQGRYAEAEAWGRKCVELARQTLPADHPDLLAMQAQYASTLVGSRHPAAAEPMIRDVIARQTRVLGLGHKDTLLSQWLLADDLIELHRDAEAAGIARSAALKLEPLLGADNSYTLSAWQTYGVAACGSHEEDAGLNALRRVEAARERILPPGDKLVHFARLGIGLCFYRSGRYAEAETALRQAVAGLEAASGPAYRRTQDGYRALRDLYLAMGRPQDAAPFAAKLRD